MPLWRTASCTSSVMSVTVSPPAVWSWCSTWNVFTRPTFCQPRTVSTGRNRHVDGGACAGASPQTTARLALGLCEVICPSCGQENPAGFRLCGMCGTPLEAAAPARQERKVLTVLFADLVGFTSRAEEMDPEDVRALLGPYWERLRDELERFGGTVEKFIGDAVMALFGAPVAHEDDPERAVRAALAIRDWALEEEGGLELRIAVNTGEALVALGARPSEGEWTAAGDVVNTAQRLEAAAPTNAILVGQATYRATRDIVEYREATPVVAKGKAAAVPAWEAVHPR